MANLLDNLKTNMAAIVNKGYFQKKFQFFNKTTVTSCEKLLYFLYLATVCESETSPVFVEKMNAHAFV